jgi:hypothetical protein
MRILSLEDTRRTLGIADLREFIEGANWEYPDSAPSSFLEPDSGSKVGLSRIIANTFLDRGPTLLWVTEYDVWPSAEHMDLFDRYRLSYGENRTVGEAPVHIFDSIADSQTFISILCLGLFFVWGVEITTLDRSLAINISHDEWLEYRFAPGEEGFVAYFEKWIRPNLREGNPSTH